MFSTSASFFLLKPSSFKYACLFQVLRHVLILFTYPPCESLTVSLFCRMLNKIYVYNTSHTWSSVFALILLFALPVTLNLILSTRLLFVLHFSDPWSPWINLSHSSQVLLNGSCRKWPQVMLLANYTNIWNKMLTLFLLLTSYFLFNSALISSLIQLVAPTVFSLLNTAYTKLYLTFLSFSSPPNSQDYSSLEGAAQIITLP